MKDCNKLETNEDIWQVLNILFSNSLGAQEILAAWFENFNSYALQKYVNARTFSL